jgi:glycosyltransferase involved in cell wall biosynthesis
MPSPYSQDLFAAVAADGRIEPQVRYMEMAAPATHWGEVPLPGYARVLPGSWRNVGGGRVHWNPGVLRAIRDTQPEVVVVAGYSSLTAQVVMRWLHWSGTPWIFWGELSGMRQLEGWRDRLRSWARYPATAWPDAIAAIGNRAAVEYERLAHEDCEIANIPYYADLNPFFAEPQPAADSTIRILYCGQLVERKGVDLLVDAFVPLAEQLPQIKLTLVGEGPLRSSLEARIPSRLKLRVEFAGFQPVEALPKFYAAADLFVLPSRHDGWGVVVNQALAAGLPIVCTEAVGAAHDLVTDGWNGAVIPADDREALHNALRDIVADPGRLFQYGLVSRQRAQDWIPERGAERWVELTRCVLEKRRAAKRPHPLGNSQHAKDSRSAERQVIERHR